MLKTLMDKRMARGWSQIDLARRADVTNNTVSRIERGEVQPSLRTMRALADVFGCQIPALFPELFPKAEQEA